MATYTVRNNNAFYKKGTVLILDDSGEYYAPSESDYPKHCHFLTAEFMDKLPTVFQNNDFQKPMPWDSLENVMTRSTSCKRNFVIRFLKRITG